MNPTVSMVTEVAATDGATTVVGVVAMDGVVAVDGACHPMGILWQLRLQVSPHCCRSNEETNPMDRHWRWI